MTGTETGGGAVFSTVIVGLGGADSLACAAVIVGAIGLAELGARGWGSRVGLEGSRSAAARPRPGDPPACRQLIDQHFDVVDRSFDHRVWPRSCPSSRTCSSASGSSPGDRPLRRRGRRRCPAAAAPLSARHLGRKIAEVAVGSGHERHHRQPRPRRRGPRRDRPCGHADGESPAVKGAAQHSHRLMSWLGAESSRANPWRTRATHMHICRHASMQNDQKNAGPFDFAPSPSFRDGAPPALSALPIRSLAPHPPADGHDAQPAGREEIARALHRRAGGECQRANREGGERWRSHRAER